MLLFVATFIYHPCFVVGVVVVVVVSLRSSIIYVILWHVAVASAADT